MTPAQARLVVCREAQAPQAVVRCRRLARAAAATASIAQHLGACRAEPPPLIVTNGGLLGLLRREPPRWEADILTKVRHGACAL